MIDLVNFVNQCFITTIKIILLLYNWALRLHKMSLFKKWFPRFARESNDLSIYPFIKNPLIFVWLTPHRNRSKYKHVSHRSLALRGDDWLLSTSTTKLESYEKFNFIKKVFIRSHSFYDLGYKERCVISFTISPSLVVKGARISYLRTFMLHVRYILQCVNSFYGIFSAMNCHGKNKTYRLTL